MVSLIIPCYNCAGYLASHVQKLLDFLPKHFPDFEILLVDDGSFDDTPRVIEECAVLERRVVPVLLLKNSGKGAAVKAGVAKSRGDLVFFTDADLPYDLEALPEFAGRLRKDCDVVLGTRTGPRGEGVRRTALSVLFLFLANLILREPVLDTQAGIKGFRKKAADTIFKELSVFRFCFDVEAIAIGQGHRMRIASLPAILLHQSESTVRVGRDGTQMLLDLLRIFWKRRVLGR